VILVLVKNEFYWKIGDTVAKEAAHTTIQTMLSQLVELWPRARGQGWQTAKHHEQMHVPDAIDAYRAHWNYHTGPSEHNHIENIKKMARMPHRWKSVLDWQIANCHADSYILDLAYNLMQPILPILPPVDEDVMIQDGISHRGAKGLFSALCHKQNISYVSVDLCYQHKSFASVPDGIHCEIFYNIPHGQQGGIANYFFTEYKLNGQTFWAHHNYHYGGNGKWYDWVMF
jgi:hypothetical protein